jgi:hypothetical protein
MKASDRKAATAAYKEQKVVAGIYTVRCSASGEVWSVVLTFRNSK